MQIEVLEISPGEILLLEENAHYMSQEKYQRLVANVTEDSVLTSTPFVWWNEERHGWECLSGNHRVKASRDAGLPKIFCLATREALSVDQRLAIQLSHNNLIGQDDPSLLKKLYENIKAIDLKAYTGLSDKELDLIKPVSLPALAPIQLEFRTIQILFLPDELERIQEVFEEMSALLIGETWLARLKDYQSFEETLETVSAAYNAKNRAVLIGVLIDLLERHLTDLSEGWKESKDSTRHWIPISAIVGNAYIPVEAGKILQEALNLMTKNKDIGKNNRWQGLEFLAANWLGQQ